MGLCYYQAHKIISDEVHGHCGGQPSQTCLAEDRVAEGCPFKPLFLRACARRWFNVGRLCTHVWLLGFTWHVSQGQLEPTRGWG